MDPIPPHEGSFTKLTLRPGDFAKIIEIMTRGGRKAFVEVDGDKLDSADDLTAGRVHAAREVDVSSYYADPAKPHFGRRHFVYLVADRAGVRFFGDSTSPEVTEVCDDLARYLKADATPRADTTAAGGTPPWLNSALWPTPLRRIPPAVVAGVAALLLLIVGFLLGRATAPRDDGFVQSPQVSPPVMPMPVDAPPTTPAPGIDPENRRP